MEPPLLVKQEYSKENDRVSSKKHNLAGRRIIGYLLQNIRLLLGWKRREETMIGKRDLCSRAMIQGEWKWFQKHIRYVEVHCTKRVFRLDRYVSNSIEVQNGLRQVHRNVGIMTWMPISNGVFGSQFYLMSKK